MNKILKFIIRDENAYLLDCVSNFKTFAMSGYDYSVPSLVFFKHFLGYLNALKTSGQNKQNTKYIHFISDMVNKKYIDEDYSKGVYKIFLRINGIILFNSAGTIVGKIKIN
jgi:hypothetical protein